MNAAAAIKLAQDTFAAAGIDVTVESERGFVRIESTSHFATCAFAHVPLADDVPDSVVDEALRVQMLPGAVASMRRMLGSAETPRRPPPAA